MLDGRSLALVSDAGTPTICDPGYKLVKECIKHNLTGLESLIGVPGTLGGALVMNAGACWAHAGITMEVVDKSISKDK